MDQHQHGARSFIPRGAPVNGSVPCAPSMRLSISTTTGSRFELCVPRGDTVEGLRRRLSQKLRVPKDRLVLLHKETRLSTGRLLDLGLADGSKLTLVPAIEAGLTSQSSRTEKTMMQALESLTETQVNDFLSGRSPLTLALGVGDHMMYVQLQLASQNAVGQQQQQQQQRHLIARSGGKVQSGKSVPARTAHPCPYPSNGTRPSPATLHPHALSPASCISQTLPCTPPNPQTHRPAPYPFHPTSPTSPSSIRTSVIRQHPQTPPSAFSYPPQTTQPLTPHLSQVSPPALSSAPSLSSFFSSPPPCSSLFPTAPVHSPRPPCSSPEPRSPAPATTFPEGVSRPPSPVSQSQEPGAVIESFVSHSPGVFSGTFSGTLPPTSQGGTCHPRRGISTILQILNDLLSATRHHQGAPPSLSQLRCPAPGTPSSPTSASSPPPTPEPSTKATSEPVKNQGVGPEHFSRNQNHSSKPPADDVRLRPSLSEENRALRCKLERLQFLMHQRRLRRRARGDTHIPSHPYPRHRRHHPWSPRERKAARRRSDGSLSGSDGSSQDELEPQEVMEESPWKPDLTSDLVLA